jgi:hypothetical protein
MPTMRVPSYAPSPFADGADPQMQRPEARACGGCPGFICVMNGKATKPDRRAWFTRSKFIYLAEFAACEAARIKYLLNHERSGLSMLWISCG